MLSYGECSGRGQVSPPQPCAVHPRAPRRLCVCRHIVGLYEVANWQGLEAKHWRLADEAWGCGAQRACFYGRPKAPQPIVKAMITREGTDTGAGGHGWRWQA